MNCTLCHTALTQKMDAFFFSCHNCSALIKVEDYYLTAEAEKATYQTHNNDINDIRYQNFVSPVTNYVINNFSEDSIGLDFGCGAAPVVTKILTDKGFNIKKYDPFFFANNDYLNYHYDYIVCCEVVEHFYYPAKEIEKLIGLLNTDGELIIHTMLYHDEIVFNNWHYRRDDTHVIIYTRETMEFIARRYRLTITQMNQRLIVLKKGRD